MSFLLIIESKKNIMNIKPIIFILYIYIIIYYPLQFHKNLIKFLKIRYLFFLVGGIIIQEIP